MTIHKIQKVAPNIYLNDIMQTRVTIAFFKCIFTDTTWWVEHIPMRMT